MENNEWELKRQRAYQEALEAERAFLASKNVFAQSRYQRALDNLSQVERECAQQASWHQTGMIASRL